MDAELSVMTTPTYFVSGEPYQGRQHRSFNGQVGLNFIERSNCLLRLNVPPFDSIFAWFNLEVRRAVSFQTRVSLVPKACDSPTPFDWRSGIDLIRPANHIEGSQPG